MKDVWLWAASVIIVAATLSWVALNDPMLSSDIADGLRGLWSLLP